MTYQEALEYIHSQNRAFCKPGLERVSRLLHAIGNPERDLRCIHVAGTNGKGSTSSMLAQILIESGMRVGLYTSPYVLRFNERIRFMGASISDEDLARYTQAIKQTADTMEDTPTEFEIITAIAFSYFKDVGCDVVVLEVGLGGRFDATNVITSPLVSVITGIAKDHTAILGDTVEAIAKEKAGIIKQECPVVWGGGESSARPCIIEAAMEKNAPYREVARDKITIHRSDLFGSVFDYKDLQNIRISLSGLYQPYNAATVLEVVDSLRNEGLSISDEAVFKGLESTYWPARFEVLSKLPTIVFDGAHNAEGIEVATKSIQQYYKGERVLLLTGVLRDKEYETIAARLAEIGAHAFVITPPNPRALPAEEYASLLTSLGLAATPCSSVALGVERAVLQAKESGRPLFILGSLYTYAEVRAAVEEFTAQ